MDDNESICHLEFEVNTTTVSPLPLVALIVTPYQIAQFQNKTCIKRILRHPNRRAIAVKTTIDGSPIISTQFYIISIFYWFMGTSWGGVIYSSDTKVELHP